MSGRWLRAAWPGLLLAAGLRLALWLATRDEPLAMGADRVVYDELAAALVRGQLDARLLFVSPLYPHLLGWLPNPQAVVGMQAIAGVATTGVLVGFALAIGAKASVARTAGLLFAGLASPLFLETQIYPTAFATAGLFAGACCFAGVGRAQTPSVANALALASGTAFALAVLLAQSFLLAPLALLLAAPLRPRARMALVLAPACIGFAASAARNAQIEPGFHPLGTNGGVTLAHGNALGSDGGYRPLPGSDASKRHQHLQARRTAEAAAERRLSWTEVDAYWRDQVLRELSSNPAHAARLVLRKSWRFATADSLWLDSSLRFARSQVPLFFAAPLGFHAILAMALGGCLAIRRPSRHVLAIVAATATTCVLFYPDERYRLPATIALCIPAAAGLDVLWQMRARARQLGLTAALLALVVFDVTRPPEVGERAMATANWASNLEWSGHTARALSLQRTLFDETPGASGAHAIARLLLAAGDLEGVRAHLGDALERFPDDAALRNDQGVLFFEQGRAAEARAAFLSALRAEAPVPEVHLNLGRLTEGNGSLRAAARHYRDYVRERPEDWSGWHALARAGFRSEAPDAEVNAALEKARSLAAGEPTREAQVLTLEGLLLDRGGMHDAALARFEAAVRLAPDLALARRHRDRLAAKSAPR